MGRQGGLKTVTKKSATKKSANYSVSTSRVVVFPFFLDGNVIADRKMDNISN